MGNGGGGGGTAQMVHGAQINGKKVRSQNLRRADCLHFRAYCGASGRRAVFLGRLNS